MENNKNYKMTNDQFQHYSMTAINNYIEMLDTGYNYKQAIRTFLEIHGFDTKAKGTEFFATVIEILFQINTELDQDLFEFSDLVDEIDPVFNLDNPACEVYDLVVYKYGLGRQEVMMDLEEQKAKSFYPDLSYNEIAYPIVAEIKKRYDGKVKAGLDALVRTYTKKDLRRKNNKKITN